MTESAYSSKGSHVVKGHQRGKSATALDQFLGQLLPGFEAGNRVARLGQVHDQARINFEFLGMGEGTHAFPSGRAVGERLWAADEGNPAVPERVEMLDGDMAAKFVVYDDRA